MASKLKRRNEVLSTLNMAIESLNIAEVSSVTPAKVVFDSVSFLLTMIRVRGLLLCYNGLLIEFIQDSVANEQDYVELGLNCADVCKALKQGLNGRRLDELSQSVLEAIEHLTT